MSKGPGTLFIVATPIGNLGDITLRAIEVLRGVDFVVSEDSRRSGKLLKHLEIKKPFRTVNDHTSKEKQAGILEEVRRGSNVAFITDAGTPLVSDPGYSLVRAAIDSDLAVDAIPGPTAFVNALVLSGLPVHEFTFFGFLPPKEKKRRDALNRLADEKRTLIFYESPYRVVKTLKNMVECLGDRQISVSREMTKKFEETKRGTVREVLKYFEEKEPIGEFVIVVKGKSKDE